MEIQSNVQLNEKDKIEYKSQAMHDKKTVKKTSIMQFPVVSLIFLIAIIAIFAAQTYAYFTYASNNNSNKIISGSVDISLIEVNDNGNFNWSAEPIRIMPASVYAYGGVGVRNTGTLPVYVRIKVEKTIIQSEDEISPGWEDLIRCNFMADNESLPEEQRDLWIYHEGYYYYKIPLESGEETTSLFDKVLFSPEMGNEFRNSVIQFKLVCQSIQSGGNSNDPTTAWGWPEDSGLS